MMRHSLNQLNIAGKFLKHLILPLLSVIMITSLVVAPANATGIYDLPSLSPGDSTWIIDQAEAISFSNQGKLSGTLKKLAQKTGNEVRMVAIRRLNYGETIDTFADKLFSKWFPTPETQANQTLLVIDTLTNNSAIRTGEEVKKLMSDEIADSVASETVGIPIRNGDKYNQALLNASTRIIAVLSGQTDPGPPKIKEVNVEGTFATAEETDDRSATVWVIGLLIVATIIPMVTYFWYVGFPG